jgi:hypothetical protein
MARQLLPAGEAARGRPVEGPGNVLLCCNLWSGKPEHRLRRTCSLETLCCPKQKTGSLKSISIIPEFFLGINPLAQILT